MRFVLMLLCVLFVSCFLASTTTTEAVVHHGGLVENYYRKSCPLAEKIVKDVTIRLVRADPDVAPHLLRLQLHDCFVRGCDGSILLDTVGETKSEKEAEPNLTLVGFDEIDEIKAAVEKVCPNVVSCADILSLAARDAVSFSLKHKPLWTVLTGRKDGRISRSSEINGNIPSPFSDFATLKKLFHKKGLNVEDLVALSGAHTIGDAHCRSFSNRLYNFTGKGDADPSLNKKYSYYLRRKCPNPANASVTVVMDPKSPDTFNSDYYKGLTKHKGMFESDAALLTDPESLRLVRKLQKQKFFLSRFADSMLKMNTIEVLTGTKGEVRKRCRFVNAK